jgi:hypothetical protein
MTDIAQSDTIATSFWEKNKRGLFAAALFIVIFASTRLYIRPINSVDYEVHIHGLQAFWNGQSPYTVQGYYEPPWSIFLIAPLVNQPLETWLALSVSLFATSVIDLGTPAALLLLAHPIVITLIASSNPEWIFIGPGLWLLYRTPKGWGRGLAWLFLTCKPQTTAILLLFDGWDALRQRDWRAVGLASTGAILSWLLFPQFLASLSERLTINWSTSVIYHGGIVGAVLVTVFILAVRSRRLDDRKTTGLLLGPVWSPYLLQYGCTALLFSMRGAGWVRNAIFLVTGVALAAVFWRDYHVSEQWGILGMVLLAALMAPAYPVASSTTEEFAQPALESTASDK